MNTKERGELGESVAASYLASKGCRLLQRNYRTRFGEIDIVAECGGYLIFAEVKLRKASAYMKPRESVDLRKQRKLRNTAEMWLSEHRTELQPRFDVIEVTAEGSGNRILRIEHIENAF